MKLIKKIHKGYCKTIYNRNRYNYFWSVENSLEVLDKLDRINNPSSIYTYDFSTLYTNLPLDLVKDELFEMIDRYSTLILTQEAGGGIYFPHRRAYRNSMGIGRGSSSPGWAAKTRILVTRPPRVKNRKTTL